jgi:Beta-L-arabinofuranosidase, GH127
MEKVSRRKFVATAAVAGTAAVLRPPAFAFENQGPGAGTAVAGPVDHEVIAPQASSFPMKNVKLQPGAFSAAADANRKYLKTLPPDRLLHTFRLTAGLPSSAEPLGEWESPIANCGALRWRTLPSVSNPKEVRYAWQSNPAATLFNGAGLPAAPFRTDTWTGLTEAHRPY